MSVSAVVFVGGENALKLSVTKDMSEAKADIGNVLGQIADLVGSITLLADVEKFQVNELSQRVIYADFHQKGFLTSLHKALAEQSNSRILVLAGEDQRFNTEHYAQLLDYSERLPHMTVIATRNGRRLPFPLVLPAGIAEDIAEFLAESDGCIAEWLEQSVYMECDLSEVATPA